MRGIDGCRAGWVIVKGEFNKPVLTICDQNELTLDDAAFIDIPIGLPDRAHRRITERYARKTLPSRSSSVFEVPCRQAVYAQDFITANKLNRNVLDKGISIQTWNICTKIRIVDRLLRKSNFSKNQLYEAHPEICFYFLSEFDKPLPTKKSAEGIKKRLEILSKWNPHLLELFHYALLHYKRSELKQDDILDAMVLWITGMLSKEFDIIKIAPDQQDHFGITMNMHFINPYEKEI